MAIVMIVCPTTGVPASTGVDTHEEWRLPGQSRMLKCTACGQLHAWNQLKSWVDWRAAAPEAARRTASNGRPINRAGGKTG